MGQDARALVAGAGTLRAKRGWSCCARCVCSRRASLCCGITRQGRWSGERTWRQRAARCAALSGASGAGLLNIDCFCSGPGERHALTAARVGYEGRMPPGQSMGTQPACGQSVSHYVWNALPTHPPTRPQVFGSIEVDPLDRRQFCCCGNRGTFVVLKAVNPAADKARCLAEGPRWAASGLGGASLCWGGGCVLRCALSYCSSASCAHALAPSRLCRCRCGSSSTAWSLGRRARCAARLPPPTTCSSCCSSGRWVAGRGGWCFRGASINFSLSSAPVLTALSLCSSGAWAGLC